VAILDHPAIAGRITPAAGRNSTLTADPGGLPPAVARPRSMPRASRLPAVAAGSAAVAAADPRHAARLARQDAMSRRFRVLHDATGSPPTPPPMAWSGGRPPLHRGERPGNTA
jgi:hypothetical protein